MDSTTKQDILFPWGKEVDAHKVMQLYTEALVVHHKYMMRQSHELIT